MRHKNNTICLTHFNDGKYEKFTSLSFTVIGYKKAEFIFHPIFSHSHFERSNSFPIKMIDDWNELAASVELKKWEKTLLPFPFETNCFDYSINRRNNVSPKSQTDCKLEYMRRKELKECNHNYYWSQHLFDNNHQILDFNQTLTNCSVKVNQTFLDKVCQKDCQITELVVSKDDYSVTYPGVSFNYNRKINEFIYSTYLAKMDLIAYFSTMGGLISMYLGLSVYYLTSKLHESTEYLFTMFIILIDKPFIHSKIVQILKGVKSISKIICLFIMYYQLFEMTNDFIVNNENTGISFRANHRFPKMVLGFVPELKLDRLEQNYPEYHKNLSASFHLPDEYYKLKYNYSLEFLIKNITELKYLTGFDDLKIDCKLQFDSHQVECPVPLEIILSYYKYRFTFNYQFFHKFFSSSITPRSISIELSGQFHTSIVYFKLYSISMQGNFVKNSISTKTLHLLHTNTFIIDSIFTKNLPKNNKTCIDLKQGLFTNNLNDEMTIDCINRELNETFGCLPVIGVYSWIRLKRDLNHFQYTICPKSTANIYSVDPIHRRCFQKSKPFCETQMFDVFNNHRKCDKPFSTKIIIFFRNNLIPEYKQNYRMNFNDWFYNCGGIIGLWFGWSAMSVSVMPLIFLHYYKLIITYYRHFKQYLFVKKRVHPKHHFVIIDNYQVIIYD